jgi:hypothetical protein
MAMDRKLGSELKVGDTIEIWGRKDRITKLTPYFGTIFAPDEAFIAEFAMNRIGMTIEAGHYFEVA